MKQQSVCYNGFLGGARSMGRVGYYFLKHLCERPQYEAFFLPYNNDFMAGFWEDWVVERIVRRGSRTFDHFIRYCSVLEARTNNQGRSSAPWLYYELNSVPSDLVEHVNSNDLAYACSSFVKDALVNSGVTIPVVVLGHGYDPSLYAFTRRKNSDPFHFLCVAENTPRKNLPLLITCFEKAFPKDTQVRLTLKLGFHEEKNLRRLARVPERVRIITGGLPEEQDLVRLYQEAHCFVLPTRGEGFGLPLVEAMATGLPVLVTEFGGHMDFCNQGNAQFIQNRGLVDSDPECFPHLQSQWADPDPDHLIFMMRNIREHYTQALEKADAAHAAVSKHWTWEAQLSKRFP